MYEQNCNKCSNFKQYVRLVCRANLICKDVWYDIDVVGSELLRNNMYWKVGTCALRQIHIGG